MTDILNENGLTVSTNPEIVDGLTNGYTATNNQYYPGFKGIYGEDINVDSNTQDGQLINLFAQGATDIREVLMQIYNSFDPDNASGRILDERCALTNIFRRGGTFTVVGIDITTDRTVQLQGLDDSYNDINGTGYTVQDNAGNQFILSNSQTVVAGTHTLLFRAKELGRVETAIGTITTPVTIVLGVTSVNNSSAPLTIGENEETDQELKIRRRQSFGIQSIGYLDGMLAAVKNLNGVTDAVLYENYTNQTDELGIPPHCVWLIVEGGSSADIANILYTKKSYGCDMRGNISYTITTISRQNFVAKWDNPTPAGLYIKFNIQPTESSVTFDQEAIKEYITNNISWTIGEPANTAAITCLAQDAIDENGGKGVAVGVLISTDGSDWKEYITPSANQKFSIQSIDITVLS